MAITVRKDDLGIVTAYGYAVEAGYSGTEEEFSALMASYKIGYPLTAATASDMTDQTKVYVYVGSEAGYTLGNWYYYDGSAWTSGGVYNSTALQTDTTLTQAGEAADAKVTGDAVATIESEIDIPFIDLPVDVVITGSYIRYSDGAVVSSSQGAYTNYIDLTMIDTIQYKRQTITGSTTTIGMAFYDKNHVYVSGIGSMTSQTSAGYTWYETDVPANAVYARFPLYKDSTLGTFSVKGKRKVSSQALYASSENEAVNNTIFPNNNLNIYSYIGSVFGYALHASTGALTANSDYITTDYIPVGSFDNVLTNAGARYWFYDASKEKISTGNIATMTPVYSDIKVVSVPENAEYLRVTISKTVWADSYHYMYGDKPISDFVHYMTGGLSSRKMYCIGDSITRGMYTVVGDTSSRGPTSLNYPYWIGLINGYEVVNLGESGGGYANKGTQSNSNGKDIVDNNTFAGADIVTIEFGVNDYKGNAQNIVLGDMSSTSGDGTTIGNMKYMIETLHSKAPTAQIIIMLPLNEKRFSQGTFSGNWAFGYAFRDGNTLADYRNAIKECAEYYNLKVIDLEEVTPINRLNIGDVLGDGLHPTIAFYEQMGRSLAPLVN